MTEQLSLRRWLCVLPLLVCGMGACAGKTSSIENTGGSSAGGSTALGGSANTGGTTGNDKSCTIDSDCDWTEIGVEILKPADCICVYGCAYIIVNKTTAERRAQQFATNCDGRHNGSGDLCGIDDCIMPPALFCLDGTCTARE